MMKSANYDEIFMQNKLQFADSLKDLRNLRQQLYSAAEYFESSYHKDDHKQYVVESSKDYVSKAIVSTVDHLGSVADKLNKFLDEKANEFSAANIRFSCIEQRLGTLHGFINLREISQQSLMNIDAPQHHKRYIIPDVFFSSAEQTFQFDKSKVYWRNCISCPQNDMFPTNQVNTFSVAFRSPRVKPQTPLLRKRVVSTVPSPNPPIFSFTSPISNKETGKRSVSPLRFTLKRSGTTASRSASPTPSINKERSASEPRSRAIISSTTNRGREIESYAKKSKNLFKALLSIHQSRKDTSHNRLYRDA